eukprot:scaffold10988_cov72-Skeletonema_dohrnii-CCMP3373.AAC.1
MTTDKLATLEDQLSSPRQISLTRIDYAKRSSGDADGGLPAMLVSMLSDAHNSSIHLYGDNTPADATINVIQEFCSDSSIDNLF